MSSHAVPLPNEPIIPFALCTKGRVGLYAMKTLAHIHHFLLDMDGTLYLGDGLIDGAAGFIQYLRDSGRGVLFFTNNPTSDAVAYVQKLGKLGIDAQPGDVLTAGAATIQYLLDETPHRQLFALAAPSYEAELRAAGLEPNAADPEAVVLSFDTSLTYDKLVRAADLLRAGLPYIATNPDKVCPTANGSIPDCGAMAALLEAATGRVPKYIGKPYPEMVRMGLAHLGADPSDTAMVGDRLYTDIAMARASGITGILVLSGETTRGDLADADYEPDFVFESVAALHDALREG